MSPPLEPFQVMAKPSGAACNLDCRYCFYLGKEALFGGESPQRMSDEVLEAYVRQRCENHPGSPILFTWQGGEPTLLGLDFFHKAVALQRRYAAGRPVTNAFQTNGLLLDEAWGAFFKREHFLVGLSLDGPASLHDRYRVDKGDQPTFQRVMSGLEVLKKHDVDFNLLTVVHRENALQPLELYRFLKQTGARFLQFIPLVERPASTPGPARGPRFAPPPQAAAPDTADPAVTDATVLAADYGQFLVTVFDEWVRHDVGQVFVQLFDVALGIWMGYPAALCLFRERCGRALALEHDGDVFSCDHFVYPSHRLGNLLDTHLNDLAASPRQAAFGEAKSSTLPAFCRRCDVRFACQGECPKNRFLRTPEGEPGLNYLCAAYKRFFHHANPALRGMAYLARQGRPPAEIMTLGVPGRQALPGGGAVVSDQ